MCNAKKSDQLTVINGTPAPISISCVPCPGNFTRLYDVFVLRWNLLYPFPFPFPFSLLLLLPVPSWGFGYHNWLFLVIIVFTLLLVVQIAYIIGLFLRLFIYHLLRYLFYLLLSMSIFVFTADVHVIALKIYPV